MSSARHDDTRMTDKTGISASWSMLLRGAILTMASGAMLAVGQSNAMAAPPSEDPYTAKRMTAAGLGATNNVCSIHGTDRSIPRCGTAPEGIVDFLRKVTSGLPGNPKVHEGSEPFAWEEVAIPSREVSTSHAISIPGAPGFLR
jgi:hypothetical protein